MSINKKKKVFLCTNCGKFNHEYKHCKEPITSWGVILVKYGDMKSPIHTNIDIRSYDMNNRVKIDTPMDRFVTCSANQNIMFLMISRKHSVGYVEFIRGRYRPEKIDQIVYLFRQMKQTEVDKVKYATTIDNGFDYLWEDFWGNKHNLLYLSKDRKRSNDNYNILKYKSVDGPEMDLKTIINITTIDYNTDEWGFPKGRRNKNETSRECAIREFKEESGYNDDEFKIIDEIQPLVELFVGTNGITYRHIYYVAELISNREPQNNITDSQNDEIGNIQFMNLQNALINIREYHISRKKLLEMLYIYYMDMLLHANKIVSLNTNTHISYVNKNTIIYNKHANI